VREILEAKIDLLRGQIEQTYQDLKTLATQSQNKFDFCLRRFGDLSEGHQNLSENEKNLVGMMKQVQDGSAQESLSNNLLDQRLNKIDLMIS
jgi:hypothetical protein